MEEDQGNCGRWKQNRNKGIYKKTQCWKKKKRERKKVFFSLFSYQISEATTQPPIIVDFEVLMIALIMAVVLMGLLPLLEGYFVVRAAIYKSSRSKTAFCSDSTNRQIRILSSASDTDAAAGGESKKTRLVAKLRKKKAGASISLEDLFDEEEEDVVATPKAKSKSKKAEEEEEEDVLPVVKETKAKAKKVASEVAPAPSVVKAVEEKKERSIVSVPVPMLISSAAAKPTPLAVPPAAFAAASLEQAQARQNQEQKQKVAEIEDYDDDEIDEDDLFELDEEERDDEDDMIAIRSSSSSSRPSSSLGHKLEIPEEFASFGMAKAKTPSPSKRTIDLFNRCDRVNVIITGYGRIGVSVEILSDNGLDFSEVVTGLILHHEIEYWMQLHGNKPNIGEVLPAFVLNVRKDGKLDVSLRPIGSDKVKDARNRLMSYMEAAADRALPVGDKSSPEEIWSLFPGISKAQYKFAVGALLREGAITTGPNRIEMVKEEDRVPMEALPWSGKSPKGWRPPMNCTVFIGNLAFDIDVMALAEALEDEIGFGKIASLKIATDADSGQSKGFAHADFFTAEIAIDAVLKLDGLDVFGREIRVERKKRAGEVADEPKRYGLKDRIEQESSRDDRRERESQGSTGPRENTSRSFSSSSGPGVRPVVETWKSRASSSGSADSGSWATVYVGDLPYKITDENLKFVVESTLSKGKGTVAAVRQSINKDTGLKRGFGYVDFKTLADAERAVKELNGMAIMGRPCKMDLEGMKKRVSSGDRDRGGGGGGGDRRGDGVGDNRSGGGGSRGNSRGDRGGGGGGGGGEPRTWAKSTFGRT